jgi:hypothetical protein
VTNVTAEDIEAARWLLGTNDNVLRRWTVSHWDRDGGHDIEERIDTVKGGTYLFCPCTGWKFQKGKGLDCKHVALVRCATADGPCMESHDDLRLAADSPTGGWAPLMTALT